MSDALVNLILFDIKKEMDDIENFIAGMNKEQFIEDLKTQKAVAMSLQILGESAGKLPEQFRKKVNVIEWHKIAGLRNRISHDYAGLDMALIWQIITVEIPRFKNQLSNVAI